MVHSQIEKYLQDVAERLSPLPVTRRNEELTELSQHLTSVVEAYRELGETEQEAVESALRQFGAPREIGRAFLSAWRRETGSWRDTIQSGLLSASALWIVFVSCTLLGRSVAEHSNPLTTLLSPHLGPIYYTALFGLSALSGTHFVGGAARRATAWGTIFGYVGPIVTYEAFYARTDMDMLGAALIVLAQAACLTGSAWTRSRWHQTQIERGRKHATVLK